MATKKSETTTKKYAKIGSLTQEDKKWAEAAIASGDEPMEYIETGNVGLDLALSDGLGLPMGASVLFWARPGCGKTTVVADACKRLIQKYKGKGETFKVLYIAIEDCIELMRSLGLGPYINSKDFLYARGGDLCWRQIEKLYQNVLNGEGSYAGVKLIVIDSINSVQSDQNQKNSVADGDFGTRSRERNNFYIKYLGLCKERGISSFFISQVRKKQNASQFEDQNRAAVSDSDMHYVDIIFKCTASTNSTDASRIEVDTVFGKEKKASKSIFKVSSIAPDCKNRFFTGNATEFLFEKGRCVWNYYTVCKLLEGNKLVKNTGGWWSFDPELCEKLNLPDTKMRKGELNKLIQENVGPLIGIIKEMGKYRVELNQTEVPVSEDEVGEDYEEENEEIIEEE